MQPRLMLYRGFNPAWQNMRISRCWGDCLDFPLEDVWFFDLDQQPELGDLALVEVLHTGDFSMKYLVEYAGRRIFLSKHPPMPADHTGLRIAGRLVARYSPRTGTPQAMPQWQRDTLQREHAIGRANGYHSREYLLSLLGPHPGRAGKHVVRRPAG